MPVRSAFPPGPRESRRHARRDPGSAPTPPRAAEQKGVHAEVFKVASRDRIIPRQRDGAAPEPPRVSYEVILALAIVVACMCGALAVGAAFTLQV
jgi:hypothetical protein